MKRLWLILFLLLIPLNVFADRSTEQTDDALITTGSGCFGGIIIQTDGTNDVTIDIYNNTAASGNQLIPQWIIPASSLNRYYSVAFETGKCLNNYNVGIYVDITTDGDVKYIVYYQPE